MLARERFAQRRGPHAAPRDADLAAHALRVAPAAAIGIETVARERVAAQRRAGMARSAHRTKAARRRRIALVGHEPDLGELAAHLLGAARPLELKKGGICRIDVEGLTSKRPGTLTWFVPPKILRKLAE